MIAGAVAMAGWSTGITQSRRGVMRTAIIRTSVLTAEGVDDTMALRDQRFHAATGDGVTFLQAMVDTVADEAAAGGIEQAFHGFRD